MQGQIGIPSSPSDKIAFNYEWISLIDVTLFWFSLSNEKLLIMRDIGEN